MLRNVILHLIQLESLAVQLRLGVHPANESQSSIRLVLDPIGAVSTKQYWSKARYHEMLIHVLKLYWKCAYKSPVL